VPAFIARIEDPSQVGEARRNARRLALDLDFNEQTAERAAIVVTEACTNLLKHAGNGQIIIGPGPALATMPSRQDAADSMLLEILALDRGPGIANLEESLQDGHSTTGTAGSGLGAIGRLSSYSEIYSRPGCGTAVLARISGKDGAILQPAETGAVQVPKPGEEVCGDQWGEIRSDGRCIFLLADGLGHGTEAAIASNTAVDTMYKHPDLSPLELLAAIHDALRHTRGAAIAIAEIDREHGKVAFGGLGNICGTIFANGAPPRRMVSTNGTAGVEARHIRLFTYPWTDGAALVMHSDGIGTHWNLSDYPGLAAHDPAVIAGVVYRDFSRGNDDATIVVAK
jgi:anti-sigma regulatory factor (Ser/Thr protein kinase)